jgi:type I restriction enzyme S subunit
MTSLVRLKYVARVVVSNVDKKSVDGDLPVRLCNYVDVYRNDRITHDIDFMTATASREQVREFRLARGDVLITKDSETPDDIAAPALVVTAADDLVCGYHLAIIRPDQRAIEPRFLFWTLASTNAREWFATQATGVTRFGLRGQSIGDMRIRLPRMTDQRGVADYLEGETKRIDALIEKKQRMITLAKERKTAVAEAVLWSDVRTEIPLMYAVQRHRPVMYGIVLPGPDVGEGGVPIVKGGDVTPERLVLQGLARTTAEIERPYARARLRAGDVLFAIRGGVGDAGIVTAELEGSNITQDVARVAPSEDFASDWLLHVLQSETFQRRAKALVRGATITGLNIRDLERVRIPWASRGRQDADLRTLSPIAAALHHLQRSLHRQIELLREHRQALITAAVTGQLDLSRAAA